MSKSDEKKLVLPSSFDAMTQIEPFVEELTTWASLDDGDSDRIMLAISEAVNNAILHGNEQNPEKNVYLSTVLKDGKLIIHIRDEGEGFDPGEIPDPLEEENLLNEGGRGIYLMRQYADDVQFLEGGTKTMLSFQLDN
ncbi:serine/threonine-protein kinase RsbW [Fodinibius salinus]|uniref:Serine/threonine-protein kinase RsbW n=1 Tax=Fodinibius salinus TaxID=860790 RepID=A0A5D3YJ88_9BACT|nr:ATP-binding protein [Fodinibius salinus]TYP92570.1 serine/threonine-protein kinase RsbW [Fodinibius salinus]